MHYKIIEKPAFTVVGKEIRTATKDGANLRRIPEFWSECHKNSYLERLGPLAAKAEVTGNVILGLCADFAPDMSEFTYVIGAEGQSRDATEGEATREVPALTWAVFEAHGAIPDSVQTVWAQIWSEFFESAPYVHGEGPDLELYPDGNPMQPDYRCEVWVPVVRKG